MENSAPSLKIENFITSYPTRAHGIRARVFYERERKRGRVV